MEILKTEQHLFNIEELEDRLLRIRTEIAAELKSRVPPQQLEELRQSANISLRREYRSLNADQLRDMENRHIEQRLWADAHLPQLSLSYMR